MKQIKEGTLAVGVGDLDGALGDSPTPLPHYDLG